jgi:protein-disulfide isomerase
MDESNQQNQQREKNNHHPLKSAMIFIAIIVFLIATFFGFSAWQKYQNTKDNKNTIIPNDTNSANGNINTALFEQLLSSGNPSFGNPIAKVKIIEFADFSCPACKKFYPAIRKVMNEYKNDIFFVFYNYLLSDASQKLAEAGLCANDQEKFWQLHDLIYQNNLTTTIEDAKNFAIRIGIDMNKFNDCLNSGKYSEEVKNETITGVSIGVEYTPTIFINGYKLVGAGSEETLKMVIEKILENK